MAEITPLYVLDIIHQALIQSDCVSVKDVSYDGDHKSGEIIITLTDGEETTDWIIRPRQIEQIEVD